MLKLPIEFELEEAGFKFESFRSTRDEHSYSLGAIRIYVRIDGNLELWSFGNEQTKTQQEITDLIRAIKER